MHDILITTLRGKPAANSQSVEWWMLESILVALGTGQFYRPWKSLEIIAYGFSVCHARFIKDYGTGVASSKWYKLACARQRGCPSV